MKTKLITLFLLITSFCEAQSIKPEEAKDHNGEPVKVCGKVYGVFHYMKGKGQPTFINFGADYPLSPFTVVVWNSDRTNFTYQLEDLKGKEVCVTGTVKMFRGKPEIVVKKESQLKR